jgi:hypothetical protein
MFNQCLLGRCLEISTVGHTSDIGVYMLGSNPVCELVGFRYFCARNGMML